MLIVYLLFEVLFLISLSWIEFKLITTMPITISIQRIWSKSDTVIKSITSVILSSVSWSLRRILSSPQSGFKVLLIFLFHDQPFGQESIPYYFLVLYATKCFLLLKIPFEVCHKKKVWIRSYVTFVRSWEIYATHGLNKTSYFLNDLLILNSNALRNILTVL